MSHRQKGEHKSRHRTQAVKPAMQMQATLVPIAPEVPEIIQHAVAIKKTRAPIVEETLTP